MYLYVDVDRVKQHGSSLYITCDHIIAPLGEKIFVILGEDRLLYVSIDSEIGKEIAIRIIKKTAWNVKQVKPYKSSGKKIIYTIPKRFATVLEIKREDLILLLGNDWKLELIPLKYIINSINECIGEFKEKILK